MIRALVFDFDGLIIDTETALIDSYGDVHAAHGLPFDRGLFLRNVGHVEYAFNPWTAFGPEAESARLDATRRELYLARLLREPPLPGVAALLDSARARNLRVALASNSPHAWVEPHLERLGLRDRFDFVACREDVAVPKPAPDLYRHVLEHFGLPGAAAIAFEDSYPGTLAAKRAGLWVVAVPNLSTAHHDFAHVNLRVRSMAECTLETLLARFPPGAPPSA